MTTRSPRVFEHFDLGLSGDILCDSLLGTSGRVANLDIREGDLGLLAIDFDHELPESANPEQFRFPVYANGDPTGYADPDATFDAGPFADGGQDIDVLILLPGELPPVLRGVVAAKRINLRWAANTEADVRAYNLYWNSGSGAVGSSVWQTVSKIEAARTVAATVTSGSGTGRITVNGTYTGAAMNATWRVKITGAGLFQYDPGTGSYNGTDLNFYAGQSFGLPGGLRVVFLDAATAYVTNDRFDFRVGPRCFFVTDELAADDYDFKVAAVDAAGNVSTLSAAITVTVDYPPDAPTDVAAVWDEPSETITVTWTDSADGAAYSLYSNVFHGAGTLDDFVNEFYAVESVASGVETLDYVLPAGLRGTVKLYLRAENASAVEESNCSLVTIECLDVVTSPLNDPFNLAGEAGPAGVAVISWSFDDSRGVATVFNVYQFTSAPTEAQIDAATPLTTVAFAAGAEPVTSYEHTTALIAAIRYYVVRAVDADGYLTKNTDYVSVTPDNTAPATPTGFVGATA